MIHSYNVRLIGTRMRSIEQRHFQWPWTTPNPVFKMTPFFDAECLVSGIRYAHGYYGRQTKNHTQAFEWYQFEWPWVTSNPDFKVTIIQRQIIRYNIEHTHNGRPLESRMMPFSMTLSDPYPRFQGQSGYLRNDTRCIFSMEYKIFNDTKRYAVSLRQLSFLLSRVSTLTRDVDIVTLSVRPSVCPSRSSILLKQHNVFNTR